MPKLPESKRKSLEQEERIAKLFSGARTTQSGGGKWKKGDVLSDSFLIECKTTVTEKTAYSIKKEVLDKADSQRREMMLPFYAQAFTFGDDKDFIILPANAMRHLLTLPNEVANILNDLIQYRHTLSVGEGKILWEQVQEKEKTALINQLDAIIEMIQRLKP